MPFTKMTVTQMPPRHWALVGFPDCGKSTFAAQMNAPMLVVDADHRFAEVMRQAAGEVFQLSENPADNVDAERIAALLKANMAGSGVKTVVIDSLTAILSPLVVAAILDNDAGRNKNRMTSFKPKALALRLLQDAVTNTGANTLWIYHVRSGLDGQAKAVESTSISVVELARLRRSLNMQLRMIEKDSKRGIVVEWARRGRSGMTLWDDTGCWKGMPEKIEQAVYGGLSQSDMDSIEKQAPTAFTGPEHAIAWGFEQGCFKDALHAQNTYNEVKRTKKPKSAEVMRTLWIAEVTNRLDAMSKEQTRQPQQQKHAQVQTTASHDADLDDDGYACPDENEQADKDLKYESMGY